MEDRRWLTIKIDVTRTKQHLLTELEGLINFCKAFVVDDSDTSRRTQIDLYGDYLKVWDLVEKKGKKWTEIAKEVFPDDFIDADAQTESHYTPNPEAARIKTEQYYNAACKLIDEGLP